MEPDKPAAKRARLSDGPLQPQAASVVNSTGAQGSLASCTTGTTLAPPASATPAAQKASGSTVAPTATKPAATTAVAKKPTFYINAREAVFFRAVSGPTAETLVGEIAAGGAPVHVDFMHQHFGDNEIIRGYRELRITVWVHARTYHTWVDIVYAAKRPGADSLGSIFTGAFPNGYCRSQDEFVAAVTSTLAALPNLATLGECVGTLTVPASAYGFRRTATTAGVPASGVPASTATTVGAPTAGDVGAHDAMAVDGAEQRPVGEAAAEQAPHAAVGAAAGAGSGGNEHGGQEVVEVTVRRFHVKTAPREVKALHLRMEPLLLFTIDGGNFIDDEDPAWEMLLPVMQAEDGGCLVLGLTTLFNFYAYPSAVRLRVSQVLVLSPWQGLGLGKALLRLSYNLASVRSCIDLTVEDPTPNLQRVREKLEVEMLLGLDWVVAQADKCIAACARGETSWPAWNPPHAVDTAKPAPPSGGSVAAAAASRPETGEPATEPAPAASSGAADAAGGSGQSQSPSQHPLLAAHDFFRRLCAVPPPDREVPPVVVKEATAAAEDAWRRKLEAAEAAAAEAAAAEAAAAEAVAAEAEAKAVQDGEKVEKDVMGAVATGRSAAGASGSGDISDVLYPSSDFVAAVSRALKMHKGQFRTVWEALLWCQSQGGRGSKVRNAIYRLVDRRHEHTHFFKKGKDAASKRLVEVPPPAYEPDADDFFMYKPVAVRAHRSGAAAMEGCSGGAAADDGAVAAGRLSIVQVAPEDKYRLMRERRAERLQQLDEMVVLLSKKTKAPVLAVSAAARSAA